MITLSNIIKSNAGKLFPAGILFLLAACISQNNPLALHAQKMQKLQAAAAAKKGLPARFRNSLDMELVFIPSGEFMMGSPADSNDADFNEMPQHRVRITKAFYMGVYEVTQGQFKKLTGEIPQRKDPQMPGSVGSDYPAEFVTQRQAEQFCEELSKKEGRKYRLPTEAEWEYACRAGTTTRYYFGNEISTEKANFNGQDSIMNGKKQIYRGGTTPVGSFPPNAFGLYDMHGNVWERCSDRYSETYYISGPLSDPQGASSGRTRVLRGGGWYYSSWFCRSATRDRFSKYDRYNYHFGFRVVCELESPTITNKTEK